MKAFLRPPAVSAAASTRLASADGTRGQLLITGRDPTKLRSLANLLLVGAGSG